MNLWRANRITGNYLMKNDDFLIRVVLNYDLNDQMNTVINA